MKAINAFVAVPRAVLQELKAQRQEQRQQERREQRIAERKAARQAEREALRKAARDDGKAEPVLDEDDSDITEDAVVVSAKPGMDSASGKSRKLVEDSIEFDLLEKQQSTIEGVPRRMMSVYTDDESDLDDLEAQGYVILGAWYTATGEQIRKLHRQLKRFMPPRLVSTVGADGEITTEEVDDETMQQIILIDGQAERKYG